MEDILKEISLKLDRLATIKEQENSGLWDLATTSRALGMTESLLKEMAQKRKVPCYRPTRTTYVFKRSEVMEWLKTKRVEDIEDVGKTAILERYING